ncbi:Glycerol-3-phosphate dehydrogenase [NAD(+)] 2, chloroplastic [Galdieria sulphuraria]|nr:Glycerol-3-phosphate dehydrogenase [NAD(+)] 2, chloroplastic [Galdieria sulphuraria]
MKSFFKEDPSFVLNTNCLNFCEHQTKFSVRNWFETHGKKGRKVPRGNVGGGSFGTAMSKVFGMKGYQVCLLVRDRNIVDGINQERRNPKYLREFTLPHSVFATSNVESALEGTQLVVHALPVQVSREVLERVAPFIPTGVPVLSTSKGLEVASHKRPLAFLSGPSFAKEIMQELPTAVVVACENLEIADFIGVEVAGALKNIIAIAAGMAEVR